MTELSLEDARALLESMVVPIEDTADVELARALGRVLADDVIAPIDVPPHDNSAMDGYALSTLPRAGSAEYKVIGASRAGAPFVGDVGPGECVRVMTGALVPHGCDAVVMQERARREGDVVTVLEAPEPRQNIRAAGEDFAKGSVVLPRGRVLRPADLGALASIGALGARVFRVARVGFFSTGDELVERGPLAPGSLYDSNRALLHALIVRAGAEPVDLGHARDDEGELRAAALRGHGCDLVLSTGGVAVGDTDHVARAIGARPIEVAMKPGRHLAVAALPEGAFVGLPGNPVAVIATFDALVAPLLRALQGAEPRARLIVRAQLLTPIKNAHPRVDFHRGELTREGGELVVRSTGHQGAGILRSVVRANCFILVPPRAGELAQGSAVDVEPFLGVERI